MDDRDIRLARKLTGVSTPSAGNVALRTAIADSVREIERLHASGAGAKEMAVATRYVAMLTLLDNLNGEDKRLAQDAAKEILARSDGRAGGEVEAKGTTVNILNVSPDDLARKMAFMNELFKQRVPVIDVGDG